MAGRKEVVYSEAPASGINLSPLPSTRFIVGQERKYPYRDALGRVNLNLVNSSLAEAEMDGAAHATCTRLRAWQRHAVRALNNRPQEERMTLDELLALDDEVPPGQRVQPKRAAKREEAPLTVPMPRRLFRAPAAGDEPQADDIFGDDSLPEADRMYRCRLVDEGVQRKANREAQRMKRLCSLGRELSAALTSDSSGSTGGSADGDDASDIYEVEAILEEDEMGGRGFLIRWAGYGPSDDTWEPEWNLAPHLVADFRKSRRLQRSHVGDDYHLGRTRRLWCASCERHFAADSFSAQQRRQPAARRVCLLHHYRLDAAAENAAATSSPQAAAALAAPATTPRASLAATTPVRPSPPSGRKRSRDVVEASPASRLPPPPPMKAARPVARSLSHRQAAIEVATSRLFGFGAI